MNKQLANSAPNMEQSQRTPSERAEDETAEPPAKKKALGKGRPGCIRKPKVSKRQERTRASASFASRKRSTSQSEKSAAATKNPPKRIAPKSTSTPSTSQQSTASSAGAESSTCSRAESSEHSTSAARCAREKREVRQPLRGQYNQKNCGTKRALLIQQISSGKKDNKPNARELLLFWNEMDAWELLNQGLVDAMQRFWSEINENGVRSTLEKVLLLAQTPNGIANCVQHLIGTLVARHVEKRAGEPRPQKCNYTAGCDTLEGEFQDLHYTKYKNLLKECGCPKCTSVLQFDINYTRYI